MPFREFPKCKNLVSGRVFFASLAVLAGVIAFVVYLPSLHNEFVNWDDYEYVRDVPEIRTLNSSFLYWAFSTFKNGNWHPLTWISYALDHHIWGFQPKGYHLHNGVLHALNTLIVVYIVYEIVRRATNRREGGNAEGGEGKSSGLDQATLSAFLTGILFGVHPIHVESVAWVSERKDLLCAFFYLLSLMSYLRYAALRGKRRAILFYIVSISLFSFALLAKPMAVTLPVVLIILDFLLPEGCGRRKWLEKVPFLALSTAVGTVTVKAQTLGGSVKTFTEYSFAERFFNAGRSYLFYLVKLILPRDLSPYYPYQKGGVSLSMIASVVFVAVVSILCVIAWRRGKRIWLVAWACYVVMLMPVIGLIQIGDQAAADRYAYLPSIPPLLIFSSGLAYTGMVFSASRRSFLERSRMIALFVGTFLVIVVLSILTRQQISVWRDTTHLWSRVIDLYPDRSALPYVGKGFVLIERGDYHGGLDACGQALRINPGYIKAAECRAEALLKLNDYEGAIRGYSGILSSDPSHSGALNNRALAYMASKRYAQARQDLLSVLQLEPDNPDAYYNLACLYSLWNDKEGACSYLEAAVRNGFADLGHLEGDGELENLRKEACYVKVLGDLTSGTQLTPVSGRAPSFQRVNARR